MGNLFSSLFFSEPPDVVLVPPLFEAAGVRGRSAVCHSAYQTTFRAKPLQQLFTDYLLPGGGHARLLLTPPGAEDVTVSARLTSGDEAGPLGARVAVRWTPDPAQPSSFAELRAGGPRGVAARCAVLHPSGVAAFASGSLAGDHLLGLRYGGARLGVGAALLGSSSPDELPLLTWAVLRAGRFTLGLERRPPRPASPFSARPLLAAKGHPLERLRDAGVCAAVAYRSKPSAVGAGAAAFTAVAEVAEGHLVLSVWQHMAVCRRVYNVMEHRSVKGITNYLDVGLRLATPLLPAADASPAFELGASWQINKNILVKGLVGGSQQSLALVAKSWWTPSLTVGLSASVRATDPRPAVRYGLSLALQNVGTPVFERGAWEGSAAAASRRYLAPRAQLRALDGERPLVREHPAGEGVSLGAAPPL